MKRRLGVLVAALALFLGACQSVPGQVLTPGIRVWHDDAHHVTCWLVDGFNNVPATISCLPDSVVSR